MRNGFEGPERLREITSPPALTSTHSVLVPPPSNPSAWGIQKGYDRLAAGARRSQRGVRIPPLLCPRSMRARSEEHTSELQSLAYLVCRLLLEKKKKKKK